MLRRDSRASMGRGGDVPGFGDLGRTGGQAMAGWEPGLAPGLWLSPVSAATLKSQPGRASWGF